MLTLQQMFDHFAQPIVHGFIAMFVGAAVVFGLLFWLAFGAWRGASRLLTVCRHAKNVLRNPFVWMIAINVAVICMAAAFMML